MQCAVRHTKPLFRHHTLALPNVVYIATEYLTISALSSALPSLTDSSSSSPHRFSPHVHSLRSSESRFQAPLSKLRAASQ